ncbi:hypothetical protein PCANC_04247 [Puccinia coronata f. sp. avenae]|uniref:Uncharacterized protein n=1 Tax=Puccinia coronata f. sp. avenae TaxID=200324 RepID=A0A2N5VX17_9BASI|nr:hypothetical protein PCANC_20641 [Puccinia coronata f. sp. avenae]PLW54533.1 hypothetical protein PCANC_04247 [Puccinia coronata f. sp. avenae]
MIIRLAKQFKLTKGEALTLQDAVNRYYNRLYPYNSKNVDKPLDYWLTVPETPESDALKMRNASDSCEQREENSSERDEQRNEEYLRNASDSCEQREENSSERDEQRNEEYLVEVRDGMTQ